MCRNLFEHLKSDTFALSAGVISTPEALRCFLARSQEIRDIRKALLQGATTEKAIRGFISSLMKEFHMGRRFEHEMAMAALAVALELRPTDFAEEFLLDLAKLRLAEMPLCIRVARECLKRRMTMAQNKTKTFRPWPLRNRVSLRYIQPDRLDTSSFIQTSRESIDMRSEHAKT